MATSQKTLSAGAAALLVLLVSAAVIAPASASTLTVFTGPACAGKTKDVNSVCGCFSINGYPGGFHFVFTQKQKARLYTTLNCKGSATLLEKETRICTRHNYKSVFFVC